MKIILRWMILLFIDSQAISYSTVNLQSPLQIKFERIEEDSNCRLPCKSEIYCYGELLHDVQMARIYQDSKTFVDKKLLYPESVVLKKYTELKKKYGTLTPKQISRFVEENFADENLKDWMPTDYKQVPTKIVNRIRDAKFREWVIEVNKMWIQLGVKVSTDVRDYPEMSSMIFMPEGFMRAGGRFREMYYWDTYWIIRGLLLSGMFKTVKGIIANMIHLVKSYGYMPGGNRKYYVERSQPPLLIQIAATYHRMSRDDNFLRDCLPYLEKEFQWWYINRTMEVKKGGKSYKLARYNVSSCFPRAESYYEDYLMSMNLTNEEKRKFFTGIKSAAETGWDFSSRHIKNKDGTNKIHTLLDTDTPSMIQVELNSILLANVIALQDWYKYYGNENKRKYYENIANEFKDAIENILWNENVGVWLDYDHELGQSRNYFYVSNLAPLWANTFHKNTSRTEMVMKYLKKEGILTEKNIPKYYGIPASNINTGEQWDFPNCWAPLQAMAIHGLHRSGNAQAREVALNLVKAWLRTMYEGFQACKFMYNKYSATQIGVPGGGGLYKAQMGFGWTNGFLLEIFDIWGLKLLSKDVLTEESKPGSIKCPKL